MHGATSSQVCSRLFVAKGNMQLKRLTISQVRIGSCGLVGWAQTIVSACAAVASHQQLL